jgi:hypothetical protein
MTALQQDNLGYKEEHLVQMQKAPAVLGLSLGTLRKRMKEYGIKTRMGGGDRRERLIDINEFRAAMKAWSRAHKGQ